MLLHQLYSLSETDNVRHSSIRHNFCQSVPLSFVVLLEPADNLHFLVLTFYPRIYTFSYIISTNLPFLVHYIQESTPFPIYPILFLSFLTTLPRTCYTRIYTFSYIPATSLHFLVYTSTNNHK